jgi:hypothetical protein
MSTEAKYKKIIGLLEKSVGMYTKDRLIFRYLASNSTTSKYIEVYRGGGKVLS